MTPSQAAGRVAVVVPSRFHAFDLAREIGRRGWLHRLVTSHPRRQAVDLGVPSDQVTSLWPLMLAHRLIPKLLTGAAQYRAYATWQTAFARAAARVLRGASIVHSWSGVSGPAFAWARTHGSATVLERSSAHALTQLEILEAEHRRLGVPFVAPPDDALERDLEEYVCADRIAVPSLFVKRSFLARGIPEERLIYAPFGAELRSFSPAERTPEPGFRVVFAGQLSLRKGIHHLLEAFRLAAIPESELWLVGGHVDETSRLLGSPPSNVKVLGHRPQAELADIYRRASVFAIASVEEGLAVVQAQGLACGLPLVCTSSTGGEDLLLLCGASLGSPQAGTTEYSAGYVNEPCRPDLMAACFRALAQDRALLAQKRAAALKLRSAGLGWDRYAEAVIQGYRGLGRLP